ncbi:MAG TPA: ATP-binding protein, partial [Candidatus Competibacteraceae bacterium]|nr:ATP-binding protein [Candidatus Competibacteraceae bacterium]
NSTHFSRLYSWLLLAGGGGLLLLLGLIVGNLRRLLRHYRARSPGARLTLRLAVLFMVIAMAPLGIVYYFSLQFLQRGIDSWFDVAVEEGLDDALELGRSALDLRMRDALKLTARMAETLANVSEGLAPLALDELRADASASELTLITHGGRILGAASSESLEILPELPPEPVLMYVRQGHDYVSLDPATSEGLQIRAVVRVPQRSPLDQPKLLQALYPVPERWSRLADSTQSAFERYKQLVFLRGPLKTSFIVTLSLVLAFSVLVAFWTALFMARRLVAPIRDLAEGTRAVAAGEYDKQLPMSSNDELGFLVNSFNQMTRSLAQARDAAQHSQALVERQRAYLEAVLSRLSSGVLTLDHDGRLRTCNAAAAQILGIELAPLLGQDVLHREAEDMLGVLMRELRPLLLGEERDWRREITQFGASGRQVLMCRGSSLSDTLGLKGGYVIVFDDITNLVQAERDAAWGEVARRLAHEIKNPLTPIQLAAERIRHKYLKILGEDEGRVLERGTHTIIQQVQAMKEMVDAFNQYARPPQLKLAPLDLNEFITEVMYLYRDYPAGVEIQLDLEPRRPVIMGDQGRLRQLVHNLVKNALEAIKDGHGSQILVSTRCGQEAGAEYVELSFRDDGPGFPESVTGNLFEPYVTTKPKGTGLGLAIVKKIVDEHGGLIQLHSPAEGGAQVLIRIPLRSAAPAVGAASVLSAHEEAG